MKKITRNLSKGGTHSSKRVSSHGVEVSRDDVIVRYRSYGKNCVLKLSKASILASARDALAKVPVMIE